jgi:hypothetical protein
MMNKVRSHFHKLGAKPFIIGTVLLLIVLDIMNSLYLRLYWVHKNLSVLFVKRLANTQGLEFRQLSQQTILEVQAMVNNAFFFFLLIVLINNLFFYFFYLRKKMWAQGYVLFYTITNSILAISFLIEGGILGWGWFTYNAASILLYFYLYLGVKTFKFDSSVTIPVNGKTGQ